MKFSTLFSILILFNIQIDAQTHQILKQPSFDSMLITDTSVIVGQFTETSYVERETNNCLMSGSNGIFINSNTKAFIIGLKECVNKNGKIEYLYEVLIDSISYFDVIEKIVLKGYTFDQLKKISKDQFSKIKANSYALSKKNVNLDDYDLDLIKQKEKDKLIEQRREQAKIKQREREEFIKQKEDSIQFEINSFLQSCKSAGIAIYYYYPYNESDYTDGTGIKFKFYDPTNKIIKYVWTTFTGYNPVGDKVLQEFSRKYNITVKSIGPIKSGEFGTYEYSYTWHNDIVDGVKINSVEIQYLDGSKKKILNPNNVILSNKLLTLYEYYFGTSEF